MENRDMGSDEDGYAVSPVTPTTTVVPTENQIFSSESHTLGLPSKTTRLHVV
jgi:hypothetical protein